MRKITLFFMSMFLVLGTAMAQKDEGTDGPVEFGLQFMSPEDSAMVTPPIRTTPIVCIVETTNR